MSKSRGFPTSGWARVCRRTFIIRESAKTSREISHPKSYCICIPEHTHMGSITEANKRSNEKKKSFFRERKTPRSVPIFYIFISRLSKGCWSGSNITIIIEIPPLLFLVSIVLHESIASDNGPQNYDETIRHFPSFSFR